ncbi:sensor histidine kinase [Cellulomonas fengjieae]|uniref:histidine kinase n=1 Tax=Cellulomonas fengjieae TaxID=2819978 RepID=A0ABS3SBV8_9CELL|nr:sensor histidine kinase [Cellulomonas fengjieae]MBO3083132.1 sensor domain-containing protein [Cellulomonas fengjieae]QVI65503.1 sensor domain-containing protein [Cellulomonas fengjieae]
MTSPTPPSSVSVSDDLRTVAPAFTDPRALLLAPVSAATWRGISQIVVGSFVLVLATLLLTIGLSLGLSLAILFVGIPLLVGTLLLCRPFARLERARLHAQLGVEIPAPRYPRRDGILASWGAVLTDGRTWAHVAYIVVAGLILTVQGLLVTATGSFALGALVYPVVAVAGDLGAPPVPLVLLLPGGVLLAWITALITQAGSLAMVRTARALVGASPRAEAVEAARQAQTRAAQAQARATQAEGRAVELTETRTAAVGAADEERRRIERDLHDGAQQRLVALGVELGSARRKVSSDPDASAALEHAHREVKETLAELRDLVRGIHPAVLTDRGLDAALSALAARSPVPVRVEVPDPPSLARASASAQAAAYFVAAEALTNAAKHAEAGAITVLADVTPADTLRLVISDDGRGGATATPGSGLDGLRSRVAALDGTFDLDSPAGAGTRLTVEVPCAS